MTIDLKIPRYNLKLLNFDFILKETFISFNKDIALYHLTNNLKNKDTQKIFINSLVVSICERIKSIKAIGKVVIYVDRNTLFLNSEERDEIIDLSLKVIKKLPFQFIISEMSVDFFADRIHNNVVDAIIVLEKQMLYTDSYDTLKFSFKDLHKFFKKYNLTYLYEVYFKRLDNKILAVK